MSAPALPSDRATAGPPTGSGPEAPEEPSTRAVVAVVARRELLARLKDRAFLASTAFLLVVVAVSVMLPLLLAGGTPRYTVAAVGNDAQALARAAADLGARAEAAERAEEDAGSSGSSGPSGSGTERAARDVLPATPDLPAARIDVRPVGDAAAAEALVRAGTAEAAVVPAGGSTPAGTPALQVVGDDEVPDELAALLGAASRRSAVDAGLTRAGVAPDAVRSAAERAEASAPVQRLLDPPAAEAGLALPISFAFAMLFFLTVFLFGMSIAQSVVEEKQSRIVEILVAAIPVRALLAGKVLGNTLLAIGQTVLLVAVGLAGTSIGGRPEVVTLLLNTSGWFLLFFVLGFLMLACLWAAAGALATRQEDLQATTVPLQVLVFVPLFAGTYVTSTGPLLTTLSYVPFTAPLTMPRRLLLGDAAWWEALLSVGIVLATGALLVALAARIYEASILRTGSRLTWRGALASPSR